MNKLPTSDEFLDYTKKVTHEIDRLKLGQEVCRNFDRLFSNNRSLISRVMSTFVMYCHRKGMTAEETALEMIAFSGARVEVH